MPAIPWEGKVEDQMDNQMWSRQAFLNDETLVPELTAIGHSKQRGAISGLLDAHEHDHEPGERPRRHTFLPARKSSPNPI